MGIPSVASLLVYGSLSHSLHPTLTTPSVCGMGHRVWKSNKIRHFGYIVADVDGLFVYKPMLTAIKITKQPRKQAHYTLAIHREPFPNRVKRNEINDARLETLSPLRPVYSIRSVVSFLYFTNEQIFNLPGSKRGLWWRSDCGGC